MVIVLNSSVKICQLKIVQHNMSRVQPYGSCRLCRLNDRLVNSDIIPKFQYKPLKICDGRYYIISPDPYKKVIPIQKTITENLLCARCDNERLSRYESHLAEVLFGGYPLRAQQDGPLLQFEGYDYKKVKNGLLAILWRMSISSRPFFSNVSLGDKHEERLRIALLNDIDLQEDEYPITVVAPYLDGCEFGDFILAPDFIRLDQNRVYRCAISGLVFSFHVGSSPLKGASKFLTLGQKRWPIARVNLENIPYLSEALLQHGRANAIRRECQTKSAYTS
jgi:hypothetical protein